MHTPVMLQEVIEGLNLKTGARVIDCTVGGGGHSEAILQQIGSTGSLLGLDKDSSTLKQAQNRLTTYKNAEFVHADFDCLEEVATKHDFGKVDAILLDLGFSSLQLDDPARGLSFQNDGPLDMRLDQTARQTAAALIEKGSERQLADIFYRYGELYDAKRFAKQIVETRKKAPINTTLELVERLGLKNPGVKAKLFQALRIAVNDELGQLERVIPQAVSLLKPGGRLAIITFHSLEDRIVKNLFKNNHLLELVNKKPLEPTASEISQNSRSRSAKLRIATKI